MRVDRLHRLVILSTILSTLHHTALSSPSPSPDLDSSGAINALHSPNGHVSKAPSMTFIIRCRANHWGDVPHSLEMDSANPLKFITLCPLSTHIFSELQDHVGEVHEAVQQLNELQKMKGAATGVEGAGDEA
ncbi:hypothetical protein EW146_g1616 [Bondarzewia mesenterica]|uniref:EKC/KEOPS complex subunit GON7 n=1 Tax=Bondarzewia mesenterica TaxID=1095465 RepID=A0A4S4M3B2_9AGAM|nr:hypothetical protein EW146_g1616 [Bondarzewia mesenterica]